MKLIGMALLSAAVLGAASAGGQRPDTDAMVSLGTVRLELGMTEAEVRRRLGIYFVVNPGGIVVTKSRPVGVVGAVEFAQGTLARVYKHWDEGLDQFGSAELVQRIIDLVATSECLASTVKLVEPTARIETLVMQCGRYRSIEISVSKSPNGPPFANVREVVSQ